MKLMLLMLFVIFVMVAVATRVGGNKRRAIEATGGYKYRAKDLLSPNEKSWFITIKEAVPHAHVFGQVALNQLVDAESGKQWRPAKSTINPRSIDFVVLKPELDVLIAIEIDDRSHNTPKRQADDEKKSHALKQAGIALLRIPATPALPADEVKRRIVETIAAHARSQVKA